MLHYQQNSVLPVKFGTTKVIEKGLKRGNFYSFNELNMDKIVSLSLLGTLRLLRPSAGAGLLRKVWCIKIGSISSVPLVLS